MRWLVVVALAVPCGCGEAAAAPPTFSDPWTPGCGPAPPTCILFADGEYAAAPGAASFRLRARLAPDATGGPVFVEDAAGARSVTAVDALVDEEAALRDGDPTAICVWTPFCPAEPKRVCRVVEPSLTVSLEGPGAVVEAATTSVTGRAPPGASVVVAGRTATVDAEGRFRADSVPLEVGPNLLPVEVEAEHELRRLTLLVGREHLPALDVDLVVEGEVTAQAARLQTVRIASTAPRSTEDSLPASTTGYRFRVLDLEGREVFTGRVPQTPELLSVEGDPCGGTLGDVTRRIVVPDLPLAPTLEVITPDGWVIGQVGLR